jgi:hypothetical protein
MSADRQRPGKSSATNPGTSGIFASCTPCDDHDGEDDTAVGHDRADQTRDKSRYGQPTVAIEYLVKRLDATHWAWLFP